MSNDKPKGFKTPFGGGSPEPSPEVTDKPVEASEGISLASIVEPLQEQYEAKQSRLTMNETHERTTILMRKDLKKRVEKLARGKKGFKTMFYNHAIETMLNAYEEQNKKK